MTGLQQYRVRSINWLEEDDAEENFKTTDFSADCAVESWCRWMDSNSNFVDGYPDRHEVEVIDAEGSRTRILVSTDWHPEFYTYAKEG